MCLVRVSVVSCFRLLSVWVSGVVVFTVVPWSPEKSPEESYGPQLVGAFTGLEVTGITRPRCGGSDRITFLPLSLTCVDETWFFCFHPVWMKDSSESLTGEKLVFW